MASVFGIDLDKIKKDNLIRGEHVRTIYGVLSGESEYSNKNHILQFNGSFLAGKNNTKDDNIQVGFAFGKNNRVGAENSLVVGEEGETYVENQLVLSDSKLGGDVGDSQSYFLTKSITTLPGENKSMLIPTNDNSFSSLKIKVTGTNKDNFSSVAIEEYLLFFNSRKESTERGEIFYSNRVNEFESGNQFSKNFLDLNFNAIQNSSELELIINDSRDNSSDLDGTFRWAVDIKNTEVESDSITGDHGFGSAYGYGMESFSTSSQETLSISTDTTSCFSPEMRVLTKDKNTKKISNLSEGDELFSLDILEFDQNYKNFNVPKKDVKEAKFTTSKVNGVFYSFADYYYVLNDTIEVTSNQPVFVSETDSNNCFFSKVEDVNSNLNLLNSNKKFVNIDSIRKVEESKEVVTVDLENSNLLFVENMLFHKS